MSYCIDCKIKVSRKEIKRCVRCSGLKRRKPKKFCKCGRQLSTKQTNQCGKCYYKTLTGQGNPNYKKGNTKNNKCKDCGIHITKNANYCKKHATKGNRNRLYGKKLTSIIKNKIRDKIKGMFLGKRHWNYKDGSAGIYPAEFFQIRVIILERDKYICQLCFNKGKDVHHIDYNKKNCDKRNLITLCSSCHSKTNTRRDFWKCVFKQIMKIR